MLLITHKLNDFLIKFVNFHESACPWEYLPFVPISLKLLHGEVERVFVDESCFKVGDLRQCIVVTGVRDKRDYADTGCNILLFFYVLAWELVTRCSKRKQRDWHESEHDQFISSRTPQVRLVLSQFSIRFLICQQLFVMGFKGTAGELVLAEFRALSLTL